MNFIFSFSNSTSCLPGVSLAARRACAVVACVLLGCSYDDEAPLSLESMRDGCSSDEECIIVTADACDLCGILSTEAIFDGNITEYQELRDRSAETCRPKTDESCGRHDVPEAFCEQGRCNVRAPE